MRRDWPSPGRLLGPGPAAAPERTALALLPSGEPDSSVVRDVSVMVIAGCSALGFPSSGPSAASGPAPVIDFSIHPAGNLMTASFGPVTITRCRPGATPSMTND